jgi:hypothetical protein
VFIVFAFWHGYNILARPAMAFTAKIPFSSAVAGYSNFMLMYPSWSFFSVYPDANVKIDYKLDDSSDVKNFYGRGEGYLDLIRYYTCVGCGNAAYQFYLMNFKPGYPWLAGKFICGLNPGAHKVSIIGLKSAPMVNQYAVFKEDEYLCQK